MTYLYYLVYRYLMYMNMLVIFCLFTFVFIQILKYPFFFWKICNKYIIFVLLIRQ